MDIISSLATLSTDEKNIGTICIDLGHSNTSIAIFENNNFIYGDSFLVGSNNITNEKATTEVAIVKDTINSLKFLTNINQK